MLQKLSEQLQTCHERAADAKRRADEATDPALKTNFLEMENHWLFLARSYTFTESLEQFTVEMSARERSRSPRERLPVPGPLFNLLPVAIYVCDPEGLILFYNRRAAELWGRSPKLEDLSLIHI